MRWGLFDPVWARRTRHMLQKHAKAGVKQVLRMTPNCRRLRCLVHPKAEKLGVGRAPQKIDASPILSAWAARRRVRYMHIAPYCVNIPQGNGVMRPLKVWRSPQRTRLTRLSAPSKRLRLSISISNQGKSRGWKAFRTPSGTQGAIICVRIKARTRIRSMTPKPGCRAHQIPPQELLPDVELSYLQPEIPSKAWEGVQFIAPSCTGSIPWQLCAWNQRPYPGWRIM